MLYVQYVYRYEYYFSAKIPRFSKPSPSVPGYGIFSQADIFEKKIRPKSSCFLH